MQSEKLFDILEEEFQLDAYLHRIGLSGPLAPTLETLQSVVYRHAVSIPYENLDTLLGLPVSLDFPSLQQKLLMNKRGGYCYEQNLLLRQGLLALGFQVTGLAARPMWMTPAEMDIPRTHMVLRIELNGEAWLADVGFGGLTLTGAIRLLPDVPQETPHGRFRLVTAGDEYIQQGEIRGEWRTTYRLSMNEQNASDYLVANWFVSTHPQSRFKHNLMAARADEGRRYTLRNNEFSMYTLDGEIEKSVLSCPSEFRSILQEAFLIDLPAHPDLDAVLARIAAMSVEGRSP